MMIFFKKIKSWFTFKETLVIRLNALDADINNLRKKISEDCEKSNTSINSQKSLITRIDALDNEIKMFNKRISNNDDLIKAYSTKTHKEKEQIINIQEKIIHSINDILIEMENTNRLISRHTTGLNTIVISEKHKKVR